MTEPSRHPEPAAIVDAPRTLITRRLPVFAVGWMGMMGLWLLTIALESRLSARAILLVAVQGAILAGLLGIARRDPRGAPPALVTGACVLLGLASIALFATAGAHGEVLAFVLLSLYLATALLFAWGWQYELALLAATLVPWGLVAGGFTFFVLPLQLGAAIAVGAVLSIAIAEGAARSLRENVARRAREGEMARVLAASRDAYRDLAETARDLIWAADLSGRLTYVNDAVATHFGTTSEALVGTAIVDHLVDHPPAAEVVGALERLAAGTVLPAVHVRGHDGGAGRWLEIVGSALHDVDGRIVGVRGIGRDVTERRLTEEALRASEARFRSAFEDTAVGMAVIAPDGKGLRVNRALCDMLGYAEDEMLALSAQEVTHPDDLAATVVAATRVLEGHASSYHLEKRYRHKNGALVWVDVSSSLVRDRAGTPLYFIAQVQDITERKQAETALHASLERLRRSEEKLRLLAQRQVTIREEERKRLGFDLHDGVCQEIVGVGILIESLRRRMAPESERAAADFDRIVRYLEAVVEHLRLLAHELRPMLLHDLGIQESLRSLAAGMAAPATRVTTDFRTPIPRLDEPTELAVYRIAQEALANAVRHAGPTTVALTLAVDDGHLRLEVADDGRGFDAGLRRADALGLASMEERALAIGGRLSVRSALGHGTTVRLECPVVARAPASAA